MPVVIEHDGKEHSYQLHATTDNAIGLKMLNLDPRDHPQVMQVMSHTPADKAGLQAKDVILSFAGVPVASREQLIDLIHKRGGQATELRVQRGAQKITLSVTPTLDPETKFGQVGVMLGIGFDPGLYRPKAGTDPLGKRPWRRGPDLHGHQRAHSLPPNGRGPQGFDRSHRHSEHARRLGENRLPPRA